MASTLIRSSVRAALNASKLSTQLRGIAGKAIFASTNQLFPNERISGIQISNIINQKIRNYSNEGKYTKDQIEKKVLEVLTNFDRIRENPAKPIVTLDSHISKDLGLDSLDHVEIIVQLEDAFGYEIPDSDYEKLFTPSEMVKYIQKRLTEI